MSKLPPIPKEQRGLKGARSTDPKDGEAAFQDMSDLNLKEQGSHGNLAQNVAATQWKTQDR